MEYSKDIILNINCKEGQAKKKHNKFLKEHKLIVAISGICGALMILDFILVYNFISLLQTLV